MVLFEGLVAVFFVHVFWPAFPYKRLMVNIALFFLIVGFYDFLGHEYGARLLEAAWQFILRDLVHVLPI